MTEEYGLWKQWLEYNRKLLFISMFVLSLNKGLGTVMGNINRNIIALIKEKVSGLGKGTCWKILFQIP